MEMVVRESHPSLQQLKKDVFSPSLSLENICASHPILACDLISNVRDGTIEVTLIIPRRRENPEIP